MEVTFPVQGAEVSLQIEADIRIFNANEVSSIQGFDWEIYEEKAIEMLSFYYNAPTDLKKIQEWVLELLNSRNIHDFDSKGNLHVL
jgi:hypothetical protein